MSRLRTWIAARPLLAIAVALILGGGIGGSSTSGQASQLEDDLSLANAAADRSAEKTADLEEELAAVEGELEQAISEKAEIAQDLDEVTADLTAVRAKRAMPALVGRFTPAAENLASSYDWQLEVVERPSAAPVGKILDQRPAPGTVMRQGALMSVTVAKPLPPGWKDVKVWSGSGPFSTGIVNIPSGKVRLTYSFSGNTNAIIVLNKKPNVWIDLLLNEIGDRSGTTRLYYTGPHWFEIEGGTWTVSLQQWK